MVIIGCVEFLTFVNFATHSERRLKSGNCLGFGRTKDKVQLLIMAAIKTSHLSKWEWCVWVLLLVTQWDGRAANTRTYAQHHLHWRSCIFALDRLLFTEIISINRLAMSAKFVTLTYILIDLGALVESDAHFCYFGVIRVRNCGLFAASNTTISEINSSRSPH